MRVLVGCETSGRVREAFRARGHDAWSCDLLRADDESEFHIRGDVRRVLRDGWELLIGHPECTYLCNSGVRWQYLGGRRENGPDGERRRQTRLAAEFFLTLWNAPIPRIALENPVMHDYARELVGVRHSQVIQPYEHGEPYRKATCLWLRGLPKLVPTEIVAERRQACWLESPGPDRWKRRSRTYEGVARAFADAWGREPAQGSLFDLAA